MKLARSAPAKLPTALPPPAFLDYFPIWKWVLHSMIVSVAIRDMVQAVADAAYARGLRAGRVDRAPLMGTFAMCSRPQPHETPCNGWPRDGCPAQDVAAADEADEPEDAPFCNGTGGPGCLVAMEQVENGETPIGCTLDQPCWYAHHAPHAD